MKRFLFISGLAIGFVVGSRMGRGPYESLERTARQIVDDPEVQRKAQAELDSVVGPHRLPEFSDRDSLPYINALIKELLRWRSVVPVGVPHRSLEDDEYRGMYIPKGATIIPNARQAHTLMYAHSPLTPPQRHHLGRTLLPRAAHVQA